MRGAAAGRRRRPCSRRRVARDGQSRPSRGQSGQGLGRLASTRHAQASGGKSGARPGLGGARHGEGRIARRRIAGARVQGLLGALQATLTGREGRASGGGPHRGSNRAWGSCRGPGGEDRRRVAAALAEKVAAGVVAEGSGSGKLLAVTAESKRCVDGALVRRRGVAAAAQSSALLGGAVRRGATARVYGGALPDWERHRGGRGQYL